MAGPQRIVHGVEADPGVTCVEVLEHVGRLGRQGLLGVGVEVYQLGPGVLPFLGLLQLLQRDGLAILVGHLHVGVQEAVWNAVGRAGLGIRADDADVSFPLGAPLVELLPGSGRVLDVLGVVDQSVLASPVQRALALNRDAQYRLQVGLGALLYVGDSRCLVRIEGLQLNARA